MAPIHFHPFFATFVFLFVLQPFVIESVKLKSVQNLQQAQKGDIIDGVNQIKKYLETYGYYRRGIKHALDNRFDDSLEFALKTYQKFYHLDVTGKIDTDTIKKMMTPRCSVPDHPLVSNYNISNYKWSKYNLTYSIKNEVNVFTEVELQPEFEKAFNSWSATSPFKFRKAANGTKGDLQIGFVRRNHTTDNYPFKPEEWAHATLPDTHNPYIGMNHFNADAIKKWTFKPTTNTDLDVESVFLHEVGHNLGLYHSNISEAVMFTYFDGGNITKRILTQDDKDGLKALYRY